MKKIKILIVDDHAIIRAGLRAYFEREPMYDVIGEAVGGLEAIESIAMAAPDVVLLDISMPGMDGVVAAQKIRRDFPDVKVLMVTVHGGGEFVQQLALLGVHGYVLKDAEREEIIKAVNSVAAGKRYFSNQVSESLIEELARQSESRDRAGDDGKKILTAREVEVLRCIAKGMTSQQAADILFISPLTIHTHRNNLMQKLDIHETAGLTRYAIENGII